MIGPRLKHHQITPIEAQAAWARCIVPRRPWPQWQPLPGSQRQWRGVAASSELPEVPDWRSSPTDVL